MSTSRIVPVVCAVLSDSEGRLLVAQRPPHKHLGGHWEFPGGKVEMGEEPAAALVREIREELGCTLQVTTAMTRFLHRYEQVTIEMQPFRCTLAPDSPPPHPHEHTALAWVRPEDLQRYRLAPADWPVVEEVLRPATDSPA